MPFPRPSGAPVRARRLVVLVGSGALVASMAAGPPPASGHPAARPAVARADASAGDDLGYYDIRRPLGSAERAGAARVVGGTSTRPSASLRRSLGRTGLFETDPTTGTVRILEKLDGYLTGPSGRPARSVAFAYVRRHHIALGLSRADLRTFDFHRDYVDIEGTHHLSWTQQVRGAKVFDAGLQAAVTRNGRLLTVTGSPVSKAGPPAPGSRVLLTTGDAIAAARRDGDEPSAVPGPDDSAEPVVFVANGRSHAAWQTITMSAERPTLAVFDAASGQLLYRRPLGQDEHSRGTAVEYFPGADHGGTPRHVDFTAKGWLDAGARKLSGNNSHAYSDVNDDQRAQASRGGAAAEERDLGLPAHAVPSQEREVLRPPLPLHLEPGQAVLVAGQPQAEHHPGLLLRQHLARPPDAGSRSASPRRPATSRPGTTPTSAAARTRSTRRPRTAPPPTTACPTPATSTTRTWRRRPDGKAPRMQMYLQHQPGTTYPRGDPFAPTDVGDEADTVYHEYTHGLSNRLVVNANGQSTLGGVQAGAMGEAWSDWYAMDYLVDQGLQQDRPGKVDVILFQFDGAGVALDRTEPIDCPLGSAADRCNGGATGHAGGYSYADFARVAGGPEVHSDGEIWAQTLWQLRAAARVADHRVPGDPGHGARAAQPVVPRHAQRDPGRRHRRLRRPAPRAHLEGLRRSRHGLLRRLLRRRRHRARRRASPSRRPRTRPAGSAASSPTPTPAGRSQARPSPWLSRAGAR